MKIGELADRTGISVRMLRYYEARCLLDPARNGNGYRDYGADDVATVGRIRSLGAAGMTLPEISHFLPCALAGRSEFEPCDELAALLRKQIAQVDGQRRKLDESRDLLATLLRQVDNRV